MQQGSQVYRDPDDGASFEQLLDAVNAVEGLRRLRFTSPHPKDFGRPLMERFRDLEKLCPHMHLPAQSGSTSVLERMNRGYSRDELLKKIELSRELVPHLALSTDLIVGFPGETDEDFEDTLALLREALFDSVYSFKYSERPYTYAAREQPDDVPEAVKAERLSRLQTAQKQIQQQLRSATETATGILTTMRPVGLHSSTCPMHWSTGRGTSRPITVTNVRGGAE